MVPGVDELFATERFSQTFNRLFPPPTITQSKESVMLEP